MDKTFDDLIRWHLDNFSREGVPMRNVLRYAHLAGPHRQIHYTNGFGEAWLRIEWADGTHAVLNAED